jgi:hypothetical protein
VFLSKEFRAYLKGKKLMTYKDLKEQYANSMKRDGVPYESIEAARLAFSQNE